MDGGLFHGLRAVWTKAGAVRKRAARRNCGDRVTGGTPEVRLDQIDLADFRL